MNAMRKTAVLVLTILLFSIGCTDFDDKLNVQVRVHNSTEKTFSKVLIDSLEYIDIQAGSKTAYKVKDGFLAPRQITAEADSLVIPISIDNVQQDTLLPGRYTYKINTFSNEDGLQFEVIQD